MYGTTRPIDQLTLDWIALGRSPESRLAMERLSEREPSVAAIGANDLDELVKSMRAAIGAPEASWAPAVVQAMLRSQSVHPLVSRAMLQALIPGLVTVARRLGWGSGGDWIDGGTFFSDLLTTAWEVVSDWSGQDRPYALPDLLSAVRCRMRRQILTSRVEREVPLGPDLDRHLAVHAMPGVSDLDILAKAIQDLSGTNIDRTDAAVLYGNRVLGFSMTELSRMTGRSRRFLTERRRRAESLLCA